MPLDHSHATATFSITGLALGCYNSETSNYEVGFIRHSCHELKVTVIKNSPTGKEVLAFPIPADHRIFIETEGGITPPQPPFHKPTAPFNRNAPIEDPEDFQWIVDLETQLNKGNEVTLKPPEFPITEARISKPFLYADKDGFVLDRLNRVNLDNPADVEPFGKLCEVIKGDITCEDGGAVIFRIEGSMNLSIRLPHLPGLTHGIVMKNVCPEVLGRPPQPSDFAIYYSVVEATDGKRFSFELEEPDVLNPDSTCNGSNAGVRSQLFPLPQA